MFTSQRVVTCGVMEKFSVEQQEQIWFELEARQRNDPNLDYLQVFHINQAEVWVIDDGNATTMLLPSEY